ncbi:hypothetical protein BV25DRAFT_1828836 [Artomyces pyxidatus]|uniref:Uncharacterized protein n=1 Tax=Artomyces pyxidatus TaxID=48021 RepID=A0ACB8STP2_9AGAM|nr:hypothetical protein BV25DRAFT_1828836 [Artomyces pyxidatus]
MSTVPLRRSLSPDRYAQTVGRNRNALYLPDDHEDASDVDTASQRSISLSSPPASPRQSTHSPEYSTRRESHPYTISTLSTEPEDYASSYDTRPSSITSVDLYDEPKRDFNPMTPSASTATVTTTYPPPQPQSAGHSSVDSFATSVSSHSKKARPESLLVEPPTGPLVLGIALVDFNHQVGPRIEFSRGTIFEDEEIAKILPFLALPDGAHLNVEDYSYFHLVPSTPNPSTIFGISCNRQIATSALLVKEPDMTRSTVQKAVVILASRPVFGPVRERLGAITLALFEQKDFTDTSVLIDFYDSLEGSLRSQLTESGLYMGTSLRELVHIFRHRVLILVKALILQKKIMLYGHPVERLCTYQYSLISLIPGLLQTLEDCGSPPLATRASTIARPTSLKTSDRKSLLAYLGLPLDLFGKDAFFQPYLPLQQLDLVKPQTKSFLCGSTNAIVTQQREIELLVNVENGTVEFRDPKIERAIALTAADRKWMDEIVKDVNDGWDEGESAVGAGMQRFKGSDDYLRIKFEEYISAALASVKYGDFLAKGEGSGVLITPGSGGDANSLQDFNPVWIAEFKHTNAFEVWQRVTDPMLFDIIEPRHPCNEKPSAISDIGLRLSEGIQELKLEQQFAPTREAISRTITAGSTGFFKAVEGVRGRWMQRSGSTTSVESVSSSILEISKSEVGSLSSASAPSSPPVSPPAAPPLSARSQPPPASPPVNASPAKAAQVAAEAKEQIGKWGAGLGSFFATRAARFSVVQPASPPLTSSPRGSISDASPLSGSPSLPRAAEGPGMAVTIPPRMEGASLNGVPTPRPLMLQPSLTRVQETDDNTPRSEEFSLGEAVKEKEVAKPVPQEHEPAVHSQEHQSYAHEEPVPEHEQPAYVHEAAAEHAYDREEPAYEHAHEPEPESFGHSHEAFGESHEAFGQSHEAFGESHEAFDSSHEAYGHADEHAHEHESEDDEHRREDDDEDEPAAFGVAL